MKKTVLSSLFLSVLLISGTLSAAVIAQNGQTGYDIVIREGAPKATRYAASELANYLKKVTGAETKIVQSKASGRKAIYIGPHGELPKSADFDPAKYEGRERFRIAELKSGDISIMGAECDYEPLSHKYADFGLLFGTYEFIERFLGVRWYTPGEFGECFEHLDKVETSGLPIDQTPAYSTRDYWPFVWNEFTSREALAFNRRLRGFGLKEGSSNHSMSDFYFLYHETDPDIFALRPDGKREFGVFKPGTKNFITQPQYCFTNPKFLKIYCDAIDAYYAKDPKIVKMWKHKHPDDRLVHVTPDDVFRLAKCHCENCVKMLQPKRERAEMSNLVYTFVKKVAEHVQKKYPDKKVICLAYERYYYPPDFKLPSNVIISICVNPSIMRFGSKRARESFEQVLRQWSEKVDEISVWHYMLPYRNTYPYYLPHIADQWFRAYPKIKGCFIELNDCGLGGWLADREMKINPIHKKNKTTVDLGQNHLTLIASMKAMWGAKYDVQAELDRYYRLFYGPAAVPMKRYFDTAIHQWENVTGGFTGKAIYEEIYPAKVIDTLESSIAEAEKLAPEGSIYRKRIDWLKKSYFNDFKRTARAYQKEAHLSKDTILACTKAPAPVIDGKLDDPFWQTLPEHSFKRHNAHLAPMFGTTFKMGFRNDGKLYIGLRATDPQIAAARLNCKDRDTEVFTDDSLEFFFRTDAMPAKAFRNITINQNGVILDYDTLSGKMNRGYTTSADIKIFRGKDFYSLEMAMPLSEIEVDPAGDQPVLRMNICRSKHSGVAESHELSCWIPVYRSFHNVSSLPAIRLVGQNDRNIEDFSQPLKVNNNLCIKNKKGKTTSTKTGCRLEQKNGELLVAYTFPEKTLTQTTYGNLFLTRLIGADLSGGKVVEIRYKNPDPSMSLMASYTYLGSDGKKHSDWIRFCHHEKRDDLSVRIIDLARDGYTAGRRREKKQPVDWKPVKLTYFAIYASTNKPDGTERSYVLDYVRVTDKPAVEKK